MTVARHRYRGDHFVGSLVALLAMGTVAWGTQCGPTLAAARAGGPLEEWADRLAETTGLPARAKREAGDVITLRLGASEGPTVVVLMDRGEQGGGLRPVEQLVGQAAALDADWLHSALTVVALPGMAADLPDAGVSLGAVTPEHNFPWRWEEARRVHGLSAGVMPAQLPWIAGLSDALLRSRGVVSVLDLRRQQPDGAAAAPDGPGSLAGMVQGVLGCGLAQATGPEVLGPALAGIPQLRVQHQAWRRVGSRTWVVDFVIETATAEVVGSAPDKSLDTGGARLGLALLLTAHGADGRVAAFACAEGQRAALELVPLSGSRPRIGSMGTSSGLRCRAVLDHPGTLPGAVGLTVEVSSRDARGASVRLEPPAEAVSAGGTAAPASKESAPQSSPPAPEGTAPPEGGAKSFSEPPSDDR